MDGGLADVIRMPERALACIAAREIAPPLGLARPSHTARRARTRLPHHLNLAESSWGTGPIEPHPLRAPVPPRARPSPACGLTRAFGSLHSPSAQYRDRLTGR